MEGEKKSELAFTDIEKVEPWEKLLSEVPAHWNSTRQNQELSGSMELTPEFIAKHTIS